MTGADQPIRLRRWGLRGRFDQRIFLWVGLMLALGSSCAQTETTVPAAANVALVTFFSNPVNFFGHKSASFKGNLFVDQDELAKMKGGRFVTISFAPGTYEFTATTWMATGPAGGGHLKVELLAHHHYYVELRDRESFPVTKMFGIRQVACEEAFSFSAKDKPVDASALMPAGKDNLIAETAFPTCPETD
jgi:hypothetical protein